jgi:hypothetical protein
LRRPKTYDRAGKLVNEKFAVVSADAVKLWKTAAIT